MGFFNPNQPNFGPPQPFITPGAGIPVGPQGEVVIPLTPQQMAQVAEAMMESILLCPPGQEHQLGMTAQQLSAFLKNLLQMPKEIQQLLALLVSEDPNPTQALIKTIIAQNPKISLEELQALLIKKVKHGEIQLTKVLQSAQMNHTTESRKMGDLMNMVSQISQKVSSSPAESLVMTMLLYLPWYPLSVHQKMQMDYQPGDDSENDDQKSEGAGEHLIMMIDTQHIGKFRIAASLIHANQIYYHVTHGPQANQALQDIENKLREAIDAQNLMSGVVEFQERAQITQEKVSLDPDTTPHPNPLPQGERGAKDNSKKDVSVRGMGGPSIQLVQGAYLLMRIIFETDDRIDLELKRAAASG